MLRILLVLITIALFGCGISHEASQNCGGTFKGICHGILGPVDTRIDEIEDRLDSVEERVSQLENDYSLLESFVNSLDSQLQILETLINDNYTELLGLINDLETDISNLQVQANNTIIEVTELSTEYRITELLNPCGDGVGFDEVLMRTSDGGIVAYFESGGNRFLSTLSPGNYSTTDGTSCNFTIDSQMRLCDNLGCR